MTNNMSHLKVLIISGPTATGKTALAVKLARHFNGELISADSRQIYQGLNIGTGKDHPANMPIHLIDLVKPDESYSVAQWHRIALAKISDIQSRGKLPIVVGGTGFYLDSLLSPHSTFDIKPRPFLRFFLNRFPLSLLQLTLRLLDFPTFQLLNNSDLHNPHRLIRKIEIRLYGPKSLPALSREGQGKGFAIYHLHLTAPNSYLFNKIESRIQKRLSLGLICEIENLLKRYSWSAPGLNCLAYKEFRPFFQKISLVKGRSGAAERDFVLKECLKAWSHDERAYARRQKTWFKKYHPDLAISVDCPVSFKKICKSINQWYNKL